MYSTHQLQLNCNTRSTCRGHASYTRMILWYNYTQLHALWITFVYRPTRMSTNYLHEKFNFTCIRVCWMWKAWLPLVLLYSHHSQTKLHTQSLTDVLTISVSLNYLHPMLITGTYIWCWWINWFGYVRLVSNLKIPKNCSIFTMFFVFPQDVLMRLVNEWSPCTFLNVLASNHAIKLYQTHKHWYFTLDRWKIGNKFLDLNRHWTRLNAGSKIIYRK